MTTTDIVPAGTDPDDLSGLEDFSQDDIVLPTIKIDHPTGEFVDGLSGERFKVLDCVVLGLVKGRVMWDKEVQDDEPPLCQSLNFDEGRPNPKFPWKESGFVKADLPEGQQQIIKCEACPFKEWGSHPTRDVPWCSEQHTYVIGLPTADGSSYAPAIITFRSSAIKPSKAYLSGFVRSNSPTFVCRTRITLDQLKRGSVNYSVPRFEKGDPIDSSFYPDFASQYRLTRTYLHTPRQREGAEGMPEGAAPAPASTARNVDNDDMPF